MRLKYPPLRNIFPPTSAWLVVGAMGSVLHPESGSFFISERPEATV